MTSRWQRDLDTMLAVCSRVGALGKILGKSQFRAATLPVVRSALAHTMDLTGQA